MATKLSKRVKKVLSSQIISDSQISFDSVISKLDDYRNSFSVKFDESIDICFELSIDPKKSDQIVKSKIKLPFHNGKKISLLIISDDNEIKKEFESNKFVSVKPSTFIDEIKLDSKVVNGFTNAFCSKDLLPKISQVAKVLGSKSLMPSIKNETVFSSVSEAKALASSLMEGSISIRNDDFGYLSFSLARLSYDKDKIKSNLVSACRSVASLKPSVIKNAFIISVSISTTMGGFSLRILNSEIFS